ncbi:MAG TPA: hypothetical protein VGB30_01480 [bacterium]|jgi:hypothetical protein
MNIKSVYFAAGLVLALSCSGGSGDPSTPQLSNENSVKDISFSKTSENSMILGAWDVIIDPVAGTVEAVPVRSMQQHWNVTPLISPPKCFDCFKVKNLSYNASTQVVTVDIGFLNPSNITGYDVRGIITDFGFLTLQNPDGYTDLFSGTPGDINPFVAYQSGPGNREFPGQTALFETLQIHDPNFPQFGMFTYIVEASWPTNCNEPYEVALQSIAGPLYSDGTNAVLARVYARDWQNNVESVTIDMTPIGGTIQPMAPDVVPDVWTVFISAATGTPVGSYDLLVKATSGDPVDQTPDMYNYIKVQVINAPTPGAEVFGPPERVSNTPGESFIWPRHSIAVTGDGVSHVVWVDNSPDPESIGFHVYYSKRDQGMWTSPMQIDPNDQQAVYATIAADSSGTLHIVWENEAPWVLGSDINYASSEDNFATFDTIQTGADGLRNVHPRIETGLNGSLNIAWHSLETIDFDQHEYDVWYMERPSGSIVWPPAVSVAATDLVVQAFPALAIGDSDNAFIVFSSDMNGSSAVYSTNNLSGDFAAPVQVTASTSYQPAIDISPTGDLLVAYFESSDGTYSDIVMKKSSNQGQSWDDSIGVSTSNDSFQIAPDIEVTFDGDIHVAWHEEDDTGRPMRVLYREWLLTNPDWQDIQELVPLGGRGAFPSMDSDLQNHIHLVSQILTPGNPPAGPNYEIWYRSSAEE